MHQIWAKFDTDIKDMAFNITYALDPYLFFSDSNKG